MVCQVFHRNKYVANIVAAHLNKEKEKNMEEEEEEEEEISLPRKKFTSNYKLAIGLSECNNIRKKLNKNHTGKVPSKAANS